ncbi:signal peptidase I [Solemya velesiana gill symbiont]|uniref:Signal peptidase I n=1 Tax=Solemya velesiana gill symbiont TaxID=1918948 RepID=A0A1T2KX41_9GAMM|nr:signal peptidase I [Solemya velesiana gill symbiont]OOZ37374.1 signal peptidase I [Solemya velesiana gill symbiont]
MNFDFPAFLVAATFITGVIWLIDSLLFASKRQQKNQDAEIQTVKEPLLVEYSRSFFPIILVVLVLRSFIVEPFRIPSGSMMPTLLVGDFILVNKFSYGLKLPVINKKIIEIGDPERGDVIVFKYPQNPNVDYIKRVVGVPGDSIAYRNKILYVNGEPQHQKQVAIYSGEGSGSSETGSIESVEFLGERAHNILVNPLAPDFGYGCQFLMRGPIKVPPGHYFAMGDNRDNSNDSRCWGLVPKKNLVGEAFGIWMSWDSNRSWSPVPVAWGRIGEGIN